MAVGSGTRSSRRWVVWILVVALAWSVITPLSRGAPPVAAQQPAELLVTVAATAEELEAPAEGGTHGGLVLQVGIENRSGRDLADLRVHGPLPARTRLASSGVGQLGQSPGEAGGQGVAWRGLLLRSGERAGPFVYRVVPAEGADGAVIFREQSVRPEVTWAGRTPGVVDPPVLRLNGLWGAGGLRRTVLPNGLTVFTRERPDTPTVALQMAVRAGSRDEDDATWGGSHWLEHAHFLGTARRPDNQAIFGAISTVGGSLNATTSHERTNYFNAVPAEEFDLALDVLADMLLGSTFPPEAFDRERRVVFEELKTRSDNPGVRIFDEFSRLVFQVSPLRRDAGGYIDTVANVPVETILAYRQKHYVTGNMAFAAMGNLRHDEAVAKIERAFGTLPRGPRIERPRVAEPIQTTPRRLEVGDGTRRAELRLGWPAAGDDDPDSPALVVLQDILGTTGRRLSEEIRDRRGLATSVGPSYSIYHDAGAFALAASTEPQRVEQVIELLLSEIQRVRDGDVSETDVATSLRAIAGRRVLGEELNSSQVGRASVEVSGVLDSFDEYRARLATVTRADVQRVAQKYLDPVSYTLVIVRA